LKFYGPQSRRAWSDGQAEGDGNLGNQLFQPGKVVAMQGINDIINFADSMFVIAFLVLWCGFIVVVSWNISARLHNQLDELSRDVHQQQLVLKETLEETRRIFTQLDV
jgi:hypothetical protein